MGSEKRFGYEWGKYSIIDPRYKKQFEGWVRPLEKQDFRSRTCLDAGCGMGRNSYWALKWGKAHSVEAFDFDDRSVAAARSVLREFPNARVSKQIIYDINWEEEFDIVFSIGVIHHLEHPDDALANLVRAVKPGGTLLIWVYSREGNEWIVKLVDPIRKGITSRLPVGTLDSLSRFCSIPLWAFVKLFPLKSPFLRQLSRYRYRHIHMIVFDQLLPKISNYWRREEVEELVRSVTSIDFTVHRSLNQVGWTVIGVKPQGQCE